MPSNPLKPGKANASHRAWRGQRPGRHPTRFSGIKLARSPEDTCVTSYEFNSCRSTLGINPAQELTGSTPKAIDLALRYFSVNADVLRPV